jgi:peptidoglycan/LPS O-acetylase OafA/YrhL
VGVAISPLQGRNLGLDLLRLVAVVLVMGAHFRKLPDEARWFLTPWSRGGWIGVDLFFVLSGFLVSGLLFREHARTGRIDVRRFLFRRAWKIYPAFWLMIGLTLFVQVFIKPLPAGPPTLQATLAEFMFVQNYVPGLWGHTWSLAVEEHFYILLAVLFGLLAKRKKPFPLRFCQAFLLVLQ